MQKRRFNIPSTRSFAEKFYPARPKAIIKKAGSLAKAQLRSAKHVGLPIASNAAYTRWLRNESMLQGANKIARQYSGKSRLWQHPFARPRPRRAVDKASVWYTAYPISMMTPDDTSTLTVLGDDGLWQAFEEIGIRGIHTGPMKSAGGVDGWSLTPSIDGHFDRISNKIDPIFGTEQQFRTMCQVAERHNGIVIDDIVPGHTGKGPDFRLAEMNYGEYPGIYHMVEVEQRDWHLLPDVPKGKDAVNIDQETEEALKKAGYIIGRLQRVIFYEPGVKETNWSATRIVRGTDGRKRRWVYLHYFKSGQPSINWLDPSFAGMKLVIGDALHSLSELGSSGLRLDANGFLGIEKSSDETPAWSEGHPLSEAANQLISGMVRKMDGFTFQELNLSVDDIKVMADDGADLSYDFINRPAYHHALATGDTEFLRLMMQISRDYNVDPASLIHALQNHDDLTYELVHFWTIHKDDVYTYKGETIRGEALRLRIRQELQDRLTGDQAPYNLLFSENGIACTTVSVIAAVLGIKNLSHLNSSQIETIKQVHLLLAMFNAMQPGVFALSGWDLSGSLPLDTSQVAELVKDGDTRWINRGAYDLMALAPHKQQASSGLPRAVNIYGTLPDQLRDPKSFARKLQTLLRIRDQYGIATSHQVDVPDTNNKAVLVMLHKLAAEGAYQATILNFSNEKVDDVVHSEHLTPDATVMDMFTDKKIANVDGTSSFAVSLRPYEGLSLLIKN